MVFLANAIVYPRAVMVHSVDTFVANSAMSCSSSFNNFTLGTQLQWINNLHKAKEINTFRFLNKSRIWELYTEPVENS